MYISRSTHNTHIEHMWVEVGSQFVRQWRAFFTRLEHLHELDVENPHHIWLLHFLFLATINQDRENFHREWNAHPLSGKAGNRSPNMSFNIFSRLK